MPRGGYRPGAGAPLGSRNNPHGRRGKPKLLVQPEAARDRPSFASARDFALWCLNAPDAVVPMDAKIRAMAVLLAGETG